MDRFVSLVADEWWSVWNLTVNHMDPVNPGFHFCFHTRYFFHCFTAHKTYFKQTSMDHNRSSVRNHLWTTGSDRRYQHLQDLEYRTLLLPIPEGFTLPVIDGWHKHNTE